MVGEGYVLGGLWVPPGRGRMIGGLGIKKEQRLMARDRQRAGQDAVDAWASLTGRTIDSVKLNTSV
eukprot:scaffold9126_cov24-Tisochrysis_lutea.AAC.1